MTYEIPLFPLNIVAFPGELVNLHIFEPRYKQLVKDCIECKQGFGIPTYLNSKVEFGTEVEILKVEKTYEDGRMDIRTRGLSVFKILDFENEWNDKLYAGGTIEYPDNELQYHGDSKELMFNLVKQLLDWLQMNDKLKIEYESNSYSIAHKIGLKLEEEYEFLQILNEKDRQEFIINHLQRLIPALERAHSAKEVISMNGHFKHLTPPNF